MEWFPEMKISIHFLKRYYIIWKLPRWFIQTTATRFTEHQIKTLVNIFIVLQSIQIKVSICRNIQKVWERERDNLKFRNNVAHIICRLASSSAAHCNKETSADNNIQAFTFWQVFLTWRADSISAMPRTHRASLSLTGCWVVSRPRICWCAG